MMLSIGYGKLLVGCVVGLLVLGGTTVGLGIGDFTTEQTDLNTTDSGDELEISALSTPTEVRPDEPLHVQLRITNAGTSTTTQQVALQLNRDGGDQSPETVAAKQVELSTNESTNVTLVAESEHISSGEYTVGVAVGGSPTPETTGNVNVLTPPRFSLNDTTEKETVVRGTNSTIRANLTNVGAYRGVETVRIAVDTDRNGQYSVNETLDERTITLAGGQHQAATATVHTADLEPGRYQ
jgi:hypothetical protein